MYKKLVLINDITDNVSDWLNEMRASMANKRSSHGAVDVIKDEIELFKVQMHLHVYFMQDTCFCFRVNGKSVNHEVQMFFFSILTGLEHLTFSLFILTYMYMYNYDCSFLYYMYFLLFF